MNADTAQRQAVVRLIAERFGIPENVALDRFYTSATAQNLADEENALYG